MMEEFYNKWIDKIKFKSSISYDDVEWFDFIEYCKNHIAETITFFINLLKTPNLAVHALDILFPNEMKYKGYCSLKEVCDAWRIYLIIKNKNTQNERV